MDPNLKVVGNNLTPWQATTGNPGGFLAMTYSVNSQFSGLVFPDIDEGKIVSAFKFECELRIGNPNGNAGRPADGFSISFARGTDPLLANVPDSVAATANFAGGIPEGGSTTGIAISFDTWSGNTLPDGPDIEGIMVRVDNKTLLRQALPTRNGACDDATSLQTGPYDQAYYDNGGDPVDPAAWAQLCWKPFSVNLTDAGVLSVSYKGRAILDNYQTTYFPSVGRLIFAGRTGGANEQTHVDNVKLTTTAVALDSVPPTVPPNLRIVEAGAGRVLVQWDAATDNSGKVAYELERDGVVLTGLLTTTRYEDRAVSPKTAYSYKVRSVDPSSNKSALTAAATATTADFVDSVGFLTAQIYKEIGGTAVADLTGNAKYPASPDQSLFVAGLDTPDLGLDNYGLRLAGTLLVPETADYNFFIRSDDGSQLFLNTAGEAIPDPMVDTPIAEETDCCDAFLEPDTGDAATTQTPIRLTANRKYGILILLKEGGGGDFSQVAWRKVGDTTAAASLAPIGGVYLTGKADPVGARVTVTQQPKDTTAIIGRKATFSVVADTFSPYTTTVLYQWYRNGAIIPGASAKTYTFANAQTSDTGAKFKVLVAVPGVSVTSSEATLSVVPDTFPPALDGAGAIASASGTTYDVGVTFDEPVDPVSAGSQANYTLSAGTITGIKYYAGSPGVVLTATGLAAGTTYTVTVKNVKDVTGNTLVSASKSFTLSPMKWGVVGGNELKAGNGVVVVAPNGFDVYSDGMTEWATYDETTFVYEEITGDFDKVLRIDYQDQSSQWARAGLIARDVQNFGVGRDEQGAGGSLAGRYQKVHVNPSGPTLTGPGTPGNNSWEGNRRLTTGGATDSAGGGGTVAYPNNWVRMQRKGELFTIFRSFDGQEWTQLGTTTFPEPMPAKLYVGPEFSPENGNITEEGSRGMWLARIRDYGNYPVKPPATVDLLSGLQGYWNFDDTFLDSINGFHGTGRGTAPIAFVDGKTGFGKAIKLDGSNQFVEITGAHTNDLEYPKGSMSIAGWFKVDAFDTGWQALISKGEGTNWRVARRDDGTKKNIGYAGGIGEGANDVPPVDDGQWHHFTAVSDALGVEFGTAIYVDGVKRGVNMTKPVLASSALKVFIGENPGARNREWNGLIDDIGIWNRVLSAAEVAALYNAGQGMPVSSVPGVLPPLDDVTRPGDAIVVTSPTSRSPANEPVANAIDGNSRTKYLDFNEPVTGAPFVGPVGFTVKQTGGASVVTGLALTSANDAPERDPKDYKLEGSNDGTTFTLISEGSVPAFAKRFGRQVIGFANTTKYSMYRFTVANVANNATANSMQIAEVEFLGTVIPAPRFTSIVRNADNSLTVEWTGGGALQAAPAVNGPWENVPGATSPYKFTPNQAALFARIVGM